MVELRHAHERTPPRRRRAVPAADKGAEALEDVRARPRVDGTQRIVEQEQRRLTVQGAR